MSERVIKGYHAHIYYDPKKTRDAAAAGARRADGVQRSTWQLA